VTKAFFLALITLAPVAVSAQSRIGIFGGYSTVSTVAELGDPTGSHPRNGVSGFTPGIAATLQLIGHLSLTAEVMTVRKGFSRTYDEPGINISTYDLDIRYTEIPLLLGERYPLHHGFSLQIQGGATWSLRSQCSETVNPPDGLSSHTDCVHTSNGEVVPPNDLSLTAGFGVVWHRLWLAGNYEFTGKNIPANSPGLGLQERTLTLMAGFDVVLGKAPPAR
jgi:hypothetical protein